MRLTRIRQSVAVFPFFQEYEGFSQNVCERSEKVRDWGRKLPNPVQDINVRSFNETFLYFDDVCSL